MAKILNVPKMEVENYINPMNKAQNFNSISDNLINIEIQKRIDQNRSFNNYNNEEIGRDSKIDTTKLMKYDKLYQCRFLIFLTEINNISPKLMELNDLSLTLTFFNAINFSLKLQTISTFPLKIALIPICKLKLFHFFYLSPEDLQILLSPNKRGSLYIKSNEKRILNATIDLSELSSPLVNKKSYSILCLGHSKSHYSCYLKVTLTEDDCRYR